jgi:hypothetical protein
MGTLDFKTPFDELSELRGLLSVREIAEMTGMRRETLSRARPDSRFQRRNQQALDDLYVVVTRMRPLVGGDTTHLAAILRRPQAVFAQRSIAELLKDGKVDAVLEHLHPSAPTEAEQLENIQFDPEILAELARTADDDYRGAEVKSANQERRLSDLLDADPELASRLPAIEAEIRGHFGPDATLRRAVIDAHDDPVGGDRLYLGVRSGLPIDEEIDRLGELVSDEDLLGPVAGRLTIGNL